jgi:hypothetical protein
LAKEDGGGDDDEELNFFGVKIRAASVELINRKVEMHMRRWKFSREGGEGKEVQRRARSTVNGPHGIKILPTFCKRRGRNIVKSSMDNLTKILEKTINL